MLDQAEMIKLVDLIRHAPSDRVAIAWLEHAMERPAIEASRHVAEAFENGRIVEREECARIVDYSMAGCDAGPAVASRIRARSSKL